MKTRHIEYLIAGLTVIAIATSITAMVVIESQARIFDNCTETSYDPDTIICEYQGDKWFVKRAAPILNRQLSPNTTLQGTLPLQEDDRK